MQDILFEINLFRNYNNIKYNHINNEIFESVDEYTLIIFSIVPIIIVQKNIIFYQNVLTQKKKKY